MKIYNDLTNIKNSSLGLGFFDGLHLGHRVILKNVMHCADKYNGTSTIVLFNEHPLKVLTGEPIGQILTLNEKLNMLNEIGIDNVVILDFEKYVNMKAEEYLKDVLIKYFSPVAITTGFNHNFGYKKEGNSEFLRERSSKYGYRYFEVPPFVVNGTIVSCSAIRDRIRLGDFVFANEMLGYKFFIEGQVIEGEKRAGSLGFPSANICPDEEKIKIPYGVYYVRAEYNSKTYDGILNYGYSPTFNLQGGIKTEVHLLDFNEDIYGKNIKISFVTKIRNQIKFENTEKLIYQLNRDKAFAQIYRYFLSGKFNLTSKNYHS